MYSFICTVLVSQIVLWNFMELRNKRNRDENNEINSSSPSSTEEPQLPHGDDASNDTDATPPPRFKRKKKEAEIKSIPSCRFCKQEFTSPQALGGHMNRHRGEREKEELQKAQTLVNKKGPNFALGYQSRGAEPSYYQPEASLRNHYQGGGGTQLANASMIGNMVGGLQRQIVYQNPNQQQFVGASQMNPNYHQQTAQANVYQPHLQHGGSYVNYNSSDNASRPPHIPSGGPQTSSYTPQANSGQYQVQGTRSLQDKKLYTMPYGSSTTKVAIGQHHPNNAGFSTGHSLSQATEGATTPIVDTIAVLETPTGSSLANTGLRQSTVTNQAITQFVDQSGNIARPGFSSRTFSTGLRPLNPCHFHDNLQVPTEIYNQESLQDQYNSQASYADASEQYTNVGAVVGMENQYHHAPGAGMFTFEDAHEGDEFENRDLDTSTIATVTESGHGGSGGPIGRSADVSRN